MSCYSKPLSVKMTPQITNRTQQPSPRHDPNMQSSSSSLASASLADPPGVRFVPTDEELIYYYLKPFSLDNNKSWPNLPIHRANIYESNPQQLSAQYKKGNLTEWFFITERTKIKENGKNQKRDDNSGGYWHGKAVQKKIEAGDGVVGCKTTLNYYVGKQPNGVKTDWLMKEYSFKSSDNNSMVDYAICKICLSPAGKKKMKEEAVEAFVEEVVQPCNIENQQPQPQTQFWPAELDSHQPQRHDDIVYQELHQPQPLNTIYHHQLQRHEIGYQEPHQVQPQPLDTTHHHHQSQRRDDIEYQEPNQPQPLDIIIHHQSHELQIWQATLGSHQTQPHDLIAYDHEPEPLDTVQGQPTQYCPDPLVSYPPHCHDIQYPQPQPLDAIEYQYLYQPGPITTYGNMIESSTKDKLNDDREKVDHTPSKIHLKPKGVKTEAEDEENEKRKKKKKVERVEASKDEFEQHINSHHEISDDDDCFFTGFVDTYLLDIHMESINTSCLKNSSDKD